MTLSLTLNTCRRALMGLFFILIAFAVSGLFASDAYAAGPRYKFRDNNGKFIEFHSDAPYTSAGAEEVYTYQPGTEQPYVYKIQSASDTSDPQYVGWYMHIFYDETGANNSSGAMQGVPLYNRNGLDHRITVQGTSTFYRAFPNAPGNLAASTQNRQDFEAQQQAGTTDPGDGNPQNCKSAGGLSAPLTWLMCPLAGAFVEFVDWAERSVIEPFLRVSPLNAVQGDPLFEIWKGFRTLANIFFVLAFIIIIFSQALSINIDAYTIKKVLPRLLIAMVAIQFSFYIVAFLVDIFNILGEGIRRLILLPVQNIPNATSVTITGGGLAIGATMTAVLIGAAAFSGVATIVAFLFGAALAIFAVIFTLAIRQILIMMLAVFAPVAFVAWILPNTAPIYKKWQSYLVKALAMYPIIVSLFAMGRLAGVIAGSGAGGGQGGVNSVLSLIATVAPLLMIPFSFKLAGGMIATIGGGLFARNKQLSGKIRDPKDSFMQGLNDRDAQARMRKNLTRNQRAMGIDAKHQGRSRFISGARERLAADAFGVGDAAKASERLKFDTSMEEAGKKVEKIPPVALQQFLENGRSKKTVKTAAAAARARGDLAAAQGLDSMVMHAGSAAYAGAALTQLGKSGQLTAQDAERTRQYFNMDTANGQEAYGSVINGAAREAGKNGAIQTSALTNPTVGPVQVDQTKVGENILRAAPKDLMEQKRPAEAAAAYKRTYDALLADPDPAKQALGAELKNKIDKGRSEAGLSAEMAQALQNEFGAPPTPPTQNVRIVP